MKFNFLKIFKRKSVEEYGIDDVPDFRDEIVNDIFDFFNDNSRDKISTQFVLNGGKSVLVSYEMRLAHASGSDYLEIYNEHDVRVAVIKLYVIIAMARNNECKV